MVHHHDLYLRETATGREWPLTTGSTATNTYARDEEINRGIEMEYDRADPAVEQPALIELRCWRCLDPRASVRSHRPAPAQLILQVPLKVPFWYVPASVNRHKALG